MLDISHLGLPPPCQDLREVEGNPKELEVPSPPGAALIASVLRFFFPACLGLCQRRTSVWLPHFRGSSAVSWLLRHEGMVLRISALQAMGLVLQDCR